MSMENETLTRLFDKWVKKLRLTPAWDVRLELVDDPNWTKTGDLKVDCDDRKAILLLNVVNPMIEILWYYLKKEGVKWREILYCFIGLSTGI